MEVYKFKIQSLYKGIDANDVMEELNAISEDGVTPQEVVEAARSEDSCMHSIFEWDDSILTDATQQLGERLELLSNGLMGQVEFRMWYFGETRAQAQAAIDAIQKERISQNVESMMAMSGATGGNPTGNPLTAPVPTEE